MSKRNDIPAVEGGSPVRKEFLIFGRPSITSSEINAVVDTMKSGWLGTGPKTRHFEEAVAEYVHAKYAIAVNSCTAGLHLALLSLGIGPGDEVITTPMTFAATANVIEHVGATPVFADIDRDSMNINPDEIKKKITKKTKAILPVHMAGRVCRMDEILALSNKYSIPIIEDAAHAFGSFYKGKPIGSVSDLTVFSFYVTKNLTTGEGGMVTTNDEKLARFIRIHSLHGLNKEAWKRYTEAGFKNYLVEAAGYKYNMTDMQSAIGLEQLKRFNENQKRREVVWNRYMKELKDLPLFLPAPLEAGNIHAYHLFTILVDLDQLSVDRDAIEVAISAENVGIGTHFIALHFHPYYEKKYHYKRGDFPNTEYISDRTISLPLSPDMSDREVTDVIESVRKVLTYYKVNKTKSKKVQGPTLEKIWQKKKR